MRPPVAIELAVSKSQQLAKEVEERVEVEVKQRKPWTPWAAGWQSKHTHTHTHERTIAYNKQGQEW